MFWAAHVPGGPRRTCRAAVAVDGLIFCFSHGDLTLNLDSDEDDHIRIFVLHADSCRWFPLRKPLPPSSVDVTDWPSHRCGHSVVAHGEDIYLIGGWDKDMQHCTDLHVFNTATLTWSKSGYGGDAPRTSGHASCLVGNSIYVFGGYEDGPNKFGQELHRLDLVTMVWSQVKCGGDAAVPSGGRFRHTATVIGRRIYVFGGVSTGSELHYFDTDTDTWHAPPPKKKKDEEGDNNQQLQFGGRQGHSAINFEGKLLVFGGECNRDYNGGDVTIKRFHSDLWLMDPATWTWSPVTPLGVGPNPGMMHSVCEVGERVFIFGGYGGEDYNDLFVLDLNPSLKTLCLASVVENGLEGTGEGELPVTLRREVGYVSTPNACLN